MGLALCPFTFSALIFEFLRDRLQWGKIGRGNLGGFVCMCWHVYGKYVSIIGLKVLGDYLNQFWSNKILVLLCEGPKLNASRISGVLNPWDPLFMD